MKTGSPHGLALTRAACPRWFVLLLVASALCACSAPKPGPTISTTAEQTVGPPTVTASVTTVGEAIPFGLNTHCGIREAFFADKYSMADPILDDGNGNPPPGWDNPTQVGTMTLLADGRAAFRDAAGHEVFFRPRPGAESFLLTCI